MHALRRMANEGAADDRVYVLTAQRRLWGTGVNLLRICELTLRTFSSPWTLSLPPVTKLMAR